MIRHSSGTSAPLLPEQETVITIQKGTVAFPKFNRTFWVSKPFKVRYRDGKTATEEYKPSIRNKWKGLVLSFLGAIGNGWSNNEGSKAFIEDRGGSELFSTYGGGILGLFSFIANFIINIESFRAFSEDFHYRLRLKESASIGYYAGMFLYGLVAILFALTAAAITSAGAKAIFGAVTGAFVAIATIIPEIQTWLEKFWNTLQTGVLDQVFAIWLKENNPFRSVMAFVAFINVWGMNILFALGLITFFITVCHGNPLLSFIFGAILAFSIGHMTEQPFYSNALNTWYDKIQENMFWIKKHKGEFTLAIICAFMNGIANGFAAYTGFGLLNTLIATSFGVCLGPVTLIVLAATFAFFMGTVSCAIGIRFWVNLRKDKYGKAAASENYEDSGLPPRGSEMSASNGSINSTVPSYGGTASQYRPAANSDQGPIFFPDNEDEEGHNEKCDSTNTVNESTDVSTRLVPAMRAATQAITPTSNSVTPSAALTTQTTPAMQGTTQVTSNVCNSTTASASPTTRPASTMLTTTKAMAKLAKEKPAAADNLTSPASATHTEYLKIANIGSFARATNKCSTTTTSSIARTGLTTFRASAVNTKRSVPSATEIMARTSPASSSTTTTAAAA